MQLRSNFLMYLWCIHKHIWNSLILPWKKAHEFFLNGFLFFKSTARLFGGNLTNVARDDYKISLHFIILITLPDMRET